VNETIDNSLGAERGLAEARKRKKAAFGLWFLLGGVCLVELWAILRGLGVIGWPGRLHDPQAFVFTWAFLWGYGSEHNLSVLYGERHAFTLAREGFIGVCYWVAIHAAVMGIWVDRRVSPHAPTSHPWFSLALFAVLILRVVWLWRHRPEQLITDNQ